jgi:hypothetical protein
VLTPSQARGESVVAVIPVVGLSRGRCQPKPIPFRRDRGRQCRCFWPMPQIDGYRALALIGHREARLVSRNGNDLGRWVPEIVEAVRSLGLRDAILDGELVALDAEDRPSFQDLRPARPGRTAAGCRRPSPRARGGVSALASSTFNPLHGATPRRPLGDRRGLRAACFTASRPA